MTRTKARPETLNHEVIARAALEVLARDGPLGLSFRRVAEVLGTYHVIVYRRCGSFEGLLDLCADHIAADFPSVSGTLTWEAATEARFQAVYDMWAAHSDLVVLMRGRAWVGSNMMTHFYEPAYRSLIEAGLSVAAAQELFSVLYRYTMGSVIAIAANTWDPGIGPEAAARVGGDLVPTVEIVNREVDISDMRSIFRNTVRKLIATFGTQWLDENARASE